MRAIPIAFIFSLIISLALSSTARATIIADSSKRVLKIVGESSYPPYEFIDQNGNPTGFSVELMREVMRELDQPYEISLHKWENAFNNFTSGNIDIVTTLAFSRQRSDRYFFTQAHSQVIHKFVCRDKSIHTLDELKDKRIIALEDDVVVESLRSMRLGRDVIEVPTIGLGFKMLEENDGDVLLCSKEVAAYYIEKMGYEKCVISDLGFYPREYCFATKDIQLCNRINMALYKIKNNGTYDLLYDKWFGNAAVSQMKNNVLYLLVFFLVAMFGFIIYLLSQRKIIKAKNQELEEYRNKISIIVDQSHLIIWEYDRVKKTFNIEGKEADHKKLFALSDEYSSYIHSEDREEVDEFKRKVNSGEYVKEEISLRLLLPESEDMKYISTGCIAGKRDDKGLYTKYVGYSVNTSEQNRLQISLQSTLELIDNIIGNFPMPFCIKDVNDNFRYVSVNPAMCSYFRRPAKQIIGLTDDLLMEARDFAIIRESDIATVRNSTLSYKHITDTPSQGIFQKLKFVIETADRRKLLIVITQDITAGEQAKEELELQKRRADIAEEADRMKSEFIANMSHEIRTPLNSIVGFSQLIGNADSEEERNEFLKIISTNSNVLVRVIDDILTVSKIEAGLIRINPRPFDFKESFHELYSSFRLLAEEKRITLTQKAILKQCSLVSDRDRVNQILGNLLSNAIKYTKPEGRVEMCCEEEGGGVKISISDTGIGIPADKLDRIFHRFEKLDNFAQGTGLGLSICKVLTDKLEGKIGFHSVADHGSTFWVWIPNMKRKKDETKA